MPRIILIETSTSLCSAAIEQDGRIICSRETSEPRAHASKTAVFVKEMLDECGLRVQDCDAVCVSAGPGSYTGLRVGSSTAKGLCFGAGIPLLAAGTLDILVHQALKAGLPEGCTAIVPMVDARRMEVYSAVYSPEGKRLTEVAPCVVGEGSFSAELAAGKVLFIGDGAAKCAPVLNSENAVTVQVNPNAAAMAEIAEEAFQKSDFQNTAYFEPFYLKEFVATVSKKNLF